MTPVADLREAGALFQGYHDRIYRYVRSIIHDPSEAEDLTQDTFLRAYCRRDSLRDPNAVRGWLYRIATRVCLDRLRQRPPRISIDGEEGSRHIAAAPSRDPTALEQAERAEASACVQRCLDYLPDNYRAVIFLYEAHSLTAPEIRLHRAHRRLQEVMEIGCAVSQSAHGVPCCEPKAGTEPRR